ADGLGWAVSGCRLGLPFSAAGSRMTLRIIFDSRAREEKLRTGWGLSVLVGDHLLFDTGENGDWLLANLKRLRIDPASFHSVVISHEHWDHTGGLAKVLEAGKGIKVFGGAAFSVRFKEQVKLSGAHFVRVQPFQEIVPSVYTTGEITVRYGPGFLTEQALVIKTEKGMAVVTGCAHPGLLKILKVVQEHFPPEEPENAINLVMGGFHLLEETDTVIREVAEEVKHLGVKAVGPTHCSGPAAERIFATIFGSQFRKVRVGDIVTF
ncbi:MAG TPA: MBL fold metallo-hydrolase, partial [bacterium]|nr:MBL fold metallo-hydrolase [bacterium]